MFLSLHHSLALSLSLPPLASKRTWQALRGSSNSLEVEIFSLLQLAITLKQNTLGIQERTHIFLNHKQPHLLQLLRPSDCLFHICATRRVVQTTQLGANSNVHFLLRLLPVRIRGFARPTDANSRE